MQIVEEDGLRKLIANEGKVLYAKEEEDKPEDERYYFEFAFIPESLTLEECQELYIEIDKGEKDEN